MDVGGTFTDVVALFPDGERRVTKVLSSGVTKGRIAERPASDQVLDTARVSDKSDFWRGARVRLATRPAEEHRVLAFDAGLFTLEGSLAVGWAPGAPYEILIDDGAPILGIRRILGVPLLEPIPAIDVRLGTTRGTNALLTRRGARTLLVTTEGLGDVLRIGTQARPALFDLAIRKPEPLFERVLEVRERLDAEGRVLIAPNEDEVRAALKEARADGLETVAVCFANAYKNPVHERFVGALARAAGFSHVTESAAVAPFEKMLWRGDTAVLDAYLAPVLTGYFAQIREALDRGHGGSSPSSLRLMTSSGSLLLPAHFTGKDAILSGPAGGVVGVARCAAELSIHEAIGFDMGGTSTDVSRCEGGRSELTFEAEKAGVRVAAPMVAVETIAAGGGSICWFDGVRLRVGPDSAGADPGPACYGRGGPLAVTDLNVVLGRVPPDELPFPLDVAAAEGRLRELCDAIAEVDPNARWTPKALALGLLAINNEHVVRAIRAISSQRGLDPATHALIAFGGAGPQHACDIARRLGVRRIIVHPLAGLLSAHGIALADVSHHARRSVLLPLQEPLDPSLVALFAELADEAKEAVRQEGARAERIACEPPVLDLRYLGVDAFLSIPKPASGTFEAAFTAEHQRLFGYANPGRSIEIVAAHVRATGGASPAPRPLTSRKSARREAVRTTRVTFEQGEVDARWLDRDELVAGQNIEGPAIVREGGCTVVVEPGFRLSMHATGALELLNDERPAPALAPAPSANPVQIELFHSRFGAIAEQMGIALVRTASSTNIKERLDFSCAIFTADGDLVVNAPHIPVHLGAMSETVRCVLRDEPALAPGDVIVTNDPYRGGSHLPDVTVITPVFGPKNRRLFFVASRAHHAEMGGIVPGSMPPFSRSLAEEGVLLRHVKVVVGGQPQEEALLHALSSGPYPSRNPEHNRADIRAQIAANQAGKIALLSLCEAVGSDVVTAFMGHIYEASAKKVEASLLRLGAGRRSFEDHLDDGTPVCVAITIDGARATADFSGTGAVSRANLNANRAITTAAVLYVVRCMLAEDIPLSGGVLAPITLVIPPGSLLDPPEDPDPAKCPAVVGGNVETSQRIVDVLLGALGLAAASQGTMNNLAFGDGTFGYYETICGGAGATASQRGADAVHTHMTNTRLTDVEVLERRYPVRVRRFSIREGSGGIGRFRGGNGVVRELEMLAPLDVSILSERRGPYAPFGLAGGGGGALGRNTWIHSDGSVENIGGKASFKTKPGDRVVIETPGGGGFGRI